VVLHANLLTEWQSTRALRGKHRYAVSDSS
jgi:hypothetical protein